MFVSRSYSLGWGKQSFGNMDTFWIVTRWLWRKTSCQITNGCHSVHSQSQKNPIADGNSMSFALSASSFFDQWFNQWLCTHTHYTHYMAFLVMFEVLQIIVILWTLRESWGNCNGTLERPLEMEQRNIA